MIAEGVETAEQAHLLKALGCDLLQGYHFSKPLPSDLVPALLLGSPDAVTPNASWRSAPDLQHAALAKAAMLP